MLRCNMCGTTFPVSRPLNSYRANVHYANNVGADVQGLHLFLRYASSKEGGENA